VHVNLPNQSEREEILRLLIGQMRLDDETSIDEVCQTLANTTNNFSGADLAALVRAAAVRGLQEAVVKNLQEAEVKVNIRHFLEAKKYDFTSSSSDQRLVDRLNSWKP
jgi:ribosome biogenesis ATPase